MKRITAVVLFCVLCFSLCACGRASEKSKQITIEDALTSNNYVVDVKWENGTVMVIHLHFKKDAVERNIAQIINGVKTEYPYFDDLKYNYSIDKDSKTITIIEIEPDGDISDEMVLTYDLTENGLSLDWVDGGETLTFKPTSLDWDNTLAQYLN